MKKGKEKCCHPVEVNEKYTQIIFIVTVQFILCIVTRGFHFCCQRLLRKELVGLIKHTGSDKNRIATEATRDHKLLISENRTPGSF